MEKTTPREHIASSSTLPPEKVVWLSSPAQDIGRLSKIPMRSLSLKPTGSSRVTQQKLSLKTVSQCYSKNEIWGFAPKILPYLKFGIFLSLSMQGIVQVAQSYHHTHQHIIPKHPMVQCTASRSNAFSRCQCVISTPTMQHKGIENTTVAELLATKEEERNVLCCHTTDTAYDAVKKMAENNVGSLVILRPGEQKLAAGIITERDYLKKIIAQGRLSKYTRVGEIMTTESKLITVSSDTNILQAMQLMTDNHLRHVPVIDGKIVGMISIIDVVRAVVEQQNQEVKYLNEFIKGDYH